MGGSLLLLVGLLYQPPPLQRDHYVGPRGRFEVRGIEREMWGSLPTPRRRMDELFRDWPDEELRIMHFFLSLRAA